MQKSNDLSEFLDITYLVRTNLLNAIENVSNENFNSGDEDFNNFTFIEDYFNSV